MPSPSDRQDACSSYVGVLQVYGQRWASYRQASGLNWRWRKLEEDGKAKILTYATAPDVAYRSGIWHGEIFLFVILLVKMPQVQSIDAKMSFYLYIYKNIGLLDQKLVKGRKGVGFPARNPVQFKFPISKMQRMWIEEVLVFCHGSSCIDSILNVIAKRWMENRMDQVSWKVRRKSLRWRPPKQSYYIWLRKYRCLWDSVSSA